MHTQGIWGKEGVNWEHEPRAGFKGPVRDAKATALLECSRNRPSLAKEVPSTSSMPREISANAKPRFDMQPQDRYDPWGMQTSSQHTEKPARKQASIIQLQIAAESIRQSTKSIADRQNTARTSMSPRDALDTYYRNTRIAMMHAHPQTQTPEAY